MSSPVLRVVCHLDTVDVRDVNSNISSPKENMKLLCRITVAVGRKIVQLFLGCSVELEGSLL